MNNIGKRKILAISLFFAVVSLVGCSADSSTGKVTATGNKQPAIVSTPIQLTDDELIQKALNSSYRKEGVNVTLMDGNFKFVGEANQGKLPRRLTIWRDKRIQPLVGQINQDEKLIHGIVWSGGFSGGGTGVFSEVFVVIVQADGSLSTPMTAFMGDRVNTQSIAIEDGYVVVNYLDRKKEEGMAVAPTIKNTKVLTLKGDKLIEFAR